MGGLRHVKSGVQNMNCYQSCIYMLCNSTFSCVSCSFVVFFCICLMINTHIVLQTMCSRLYGEYRNVWQQNGVKWLIYDEHGH